MEEKIEALLKVLQDALQDMLEMHKDNYTIQKEMVEMLKNQNAELRSNLEANVVQQENRPQVDANQPSVATSGENRPLFSQVKPKPIRPKIEAEQDDIGWNIFLDKWNHYKSIAMISNEKKNSWSCVNHVPLKFHVFFISMQALSISMMRL